MKRYNIMDEVESLTGNMVYYSEAIEAIEKAVKAEREACAAVCEEMLFEKWTDVDRQVLCAEAIRNRK